MGRPNVRLFLGGSHESKETIRRRCSRRRGVRARPLDGVGGGARARGRRGAALSEGVVESEEPEIAAVEEGGDLQEGVTDDAGVDPVEAVEVSGAETAEALESIGVEGVEAIEPQDATGEKGLGASSSLIASGTCGTCPWKITSAGKLVIGAGTLDSNSKADYWPEDFWPWYDYRESIKSVTTSGTVRGTGSLACLFYKCSSLTTANLSGLDVSGVTDLYELFGYCPSLTKANLSGWDTSGVTKMSYMFDGCSSLKSVNVSDFDTSNVKDMNGVFMGCKKLTSLNLSAWNTSKVKYMWGLFNDCSSLKSLNVSGWNTSKVQIMGIMFKGCSSLAKLDLSSWSTQSLMGAGEESFNPSESMYGGCSSLKTWKVGKGYWRGVIEVPSPANSSGKWWSAKKLAWLTPKQIANSRSNVADTYTATKVKGANPMAVKAVRRTAKQATLKKKAVTVARPIKFAKAAKGKVTYAKASGSARLTVNKTTGKVTVKKGTKKGTYAIKIKVKAAGTYQYKAKAKTITCKVTVK